MPTMLEIVREKRATIATERAALLTEADELAADETRDDAATRGDEIIGRLAELRDEDSGLATTEAELVDATERAANAARTPHYNRPTEPIDPTRASDGEVRSAALSFIDQSHSFVRDDDREALTRTIQRGGTIGAAAARIALTTGTDLYVRAWSKYMSGNSLALTEPERAALARGFDRYSDEERAGMTSGTGSTGGYLVPIFIDPTLIITGAGSINPLRDLATVKQIGPAQSGWNGATAAQVTAAWTAETSAAPDNTPTLTQPNIPVYMAEAFIPVSFQAFEDIADLASDVQMLFSDAKDNLEASAHQTGSGSSQPTGVVTAVAAITASRVSPTTGGTVGIEDSFLVHSALPARFRNGRLAWLSSLTISDRLRRVSMAQNSANSVWTQPDAANPGRLLGDRLLEASAMSTSVTTGQDVLLYGDFSRFLIVDRIGFTTEFIPNLFDTSTGRPTAQRGWLAHWRTGANATDTNAFRVLRL